MLHFIFDAGSVIAGIACAVGNFLFAVGGVFSGAGEIPCAVGSVFSGVGGVPCVVGDISCAGLLACVVAQVSCVVGSGLCFVASHLLGSIFGLLAIEYAGVVLAVLADLVSGLRRARREGRVCSSRGLRRSVAKLSSYFLALFCLSVVDGMIIMAVITLADMGRESVPPFPYLSTVGALSLALIEARSIAENSPHRTDFFNALRVLMGILKRRG